MLLHRQELKNMFWCQNQPCSLSSFLFLAFIIFFIFLSGVASAQTTTSAFTTTSGPITNITAPLRFLLVGDSFVATSSPVGELLKKSLLSYSGVQVYRLGKVSSGLARPDFFDWNTKAKELVNLFQPNVVVIMLGANDDQPLKVMNEQGQKRYLKFGTAQWREEYGRRVANFIKIFQDHEATVFWVGLPIMRDQDRAERMKVINSVCQKQIKGLENSYFIATWELLCNKKGGYAAFLPNQKGQYQATHASDGIHLSFFSGSILVKQILGQVDALLALNNSRWHVLGSR
ncbi:MAG: DUF459 domain-containing protein [Candidatus Pacebacteria bacterium]|nr:DUF459 domain-containing protein [Candidatus Paceibacterota bacterium]